MGNTQRDDTPTDSSLVLLARQGDERAFCALTTRYKPLVASVLHHRLSDHRDVEDEVQETFLSAYRKLDALDDPARFSAWIARIAVNRAHTCARQLARQRETPSGTREMVDQLSSHHLWVGQYGLAWLADRETLRRAVDALQSDCRVPLLLWAVEGLSYAETAERLDVSAKVASGRIRRGCRQIRAGASVAA
ncbi:hypothetical protein CMK11_02285 [Candidatus Poribacteria bacterium]|nr:hypothetical protein [Candidatus Poribacteria bacterium]